MDGSSQLLQKPEAEPQLAEPFFFFFEEMNRNRSAVPFVRTIHKKQKKGGKLSPPKPSDSEPKTRTA